MGCPQTTPITPLYIKKMKNLKVSVASRVIVAPGCSKGSEFSCGIMYRAY